MRKKNIFKWDDIRLCKLLAMKIAHTSTELGLKSPRSLSTKQRKKIAKELIPVVRIFGYSAAKDENYTAILQQMDWWLTTQADCSLHSHHLKNKTRGFHWLQSEGMEL